MKKYLAIVFVVALAGAGYAFYQKKSKPAETFREVTIERGDIATTIVATGTVQPENRLEIKPPIAGRADSVLVDEGMRVRKGQILAWMSSTERAALLDAARAEGPEEYARWEKLYRPTPVIAPISGTIISRAIEPGQTFTATDAVLVMSDRLTVKAQVDETDIAQVKLKQPAELTLDAYPGQKVAAKVDQIAYDAKTVNNVTTYSVDVLPLQTPEFMRSGMTANVTFFTEARNQVVLVPNETIKIVDGKTAVLTRGPAGDTLTKTIDLGLSDGKFTEVTGGLDAGELVLVPIYALKDKKSSGASPFSPMGGRPRGAGSGGRR